MKIKRILIVLTIILSFSLTIKTNKVQAVLQSNGNTPSSKARNTWMTEIRKIETLNGGFGLTETQNADLTSEISNNIDVHMQKNTEYGAMALLSASSYGKPDKIGNGETTTGNKSGVYIPYNNEWTAAQYTDYYNLPSYNDRYINNYGIASDRTKKRGDALLETQGWHGSSSTFVEYAYDPGSHWEYTVGYQRPGGIIRNFSNGIFSFSNRAYYYYTGSFGAVWTAEAEARPELSYKSRFVVINGEGF